ncbi:MAG TPA: hypothetical protein PLP57_07970 [Candidatus Saccharicenans sp.]|jgi:hypothetical protein|nr:hypothetical protein [Candidatus Saccharicenans sp.]HRD02560.1 hypothetical protein [Candidatus Saccharicenans sp.]
MLKKFMAVLLFLSFCAPVWLLAQEQDLVEMAKKEKARRESLKGKEIKVITNQDLQKMTKTPAIIIAGEIAATTETQENQQPPSQPANYTPPVVHRVTVGNPAQAQSAQSRAPGLDAMGNSLEDAWKKAKEYVELLTLKMNALWQQFYALTDMQTKESIQREISDTYEKLINAQEEETRLRQAYEEQINQKKSAEAPAIWIR